jgi:type I restriction enzyme S subunit
VSIESLTSPKSIPQGNLIKLESCGVLHCGQSPSVAEVNTDCLGVPYFTGPEQWDGSKLHVEKWTEHPKRMVPDGCIFITVKGAGVGKLFPGIAGAIGRDIYAFEVHEVLSFKYILYALRHTIDTVVGNAKGDIPGLSKSHILDHSIVLPSVNQQHRIVAKIEELFSELDKGVESLTTAREQLKVYRHAVLKHAFEGKLTADWRAKMQVQSGSAEVLLAQIREERERCDQARRGELKAAALSWRAAGELGPKPATLRQLKISQPVDKEEIAGLRDSPNGWLWVRPEDVASNLPHSIGIGPFGSNLTVSDYRTSGIPLVFVRNITRKNFQLDLKFVDQDKFAELRAHTALPNDILITKMGDPPGDCAIYPTTAPEAVITADCLKFRVWDKFVDRRFYAYCIESTLVRKQLGLLTRGVAQKKISVERFKTLVLPFPVLEEQSEIASRLESITSGIELAVSTIDQELAKSVALRQSILQKAFSGQLVPQDPNDEPASVLLERIKAEKERSADNKQKTKKLKAQGAAV